MVARLEIIEGFDGYNSTAELQAAGYGLMTLSSSVARTGNKSMRSYTGAPYLSNIRGFAAGRSVIIGFGMSVYVEPTLARNFLQLVPPGASGSGSDSSQLVFRRDVNGAIQVYRGHIVSGGTSNTNEPNGTLIGQTAAATLLLSTTAFTYIEVRAFIDNTNGYVEVLVDGLQVLELTGIDTQYQTDVNTVSGAWFGSICGADPTYFDDLYVYTDDADALTPQQCLRDARVMTLAPVADGSYTQFTPSSGTTHYTLVDETPADAADYVSTSTTGARETYKFANLVGYGNIAGVKPTLTSVKGDAGFRAFKPLAKSGASEGLLSPIAFPVGTSTRGGIHETDPSTGSKWMLSGLNAAEFGLELV